MGYSISEEAKGGRGCSLSRRRHLLLPRSLLSPSAALAHLILASSTSSSFFPSPSLSLFFYSPFPLPLSSLSAFTSFVPPRRNETLAEIETRHSKKIFHALTRASELLFPVLEEQRLFQCNKGSEKRRFKLS